MPCNGLLLYVNLKVFKQKGHSPFFANIFKYSYPSLVISNSLPIIFTLSFNKIFECLIHKKNIYLGFLPSFILASRAVKISFHIYDKNVPPPSALIYLFQSSKTIQYYFCEALQLFIVHFLFYVAAVFVALVYLLPLLFLSLNFHTVNYVLLSSLTTYNVIQIHQ